jgi:hypothetical protein
MITNYNMKTKVNTIVYLVDEEFLVKMFELKFYLFNKDYFHNFGFY